jgi:hypothetical protein
VFWTYHLYFSGVIILVSLYDKKIFHARIRIRRNDYETFYLNSKEGKFSLFGGLLSHTSYELRNSIVEPSRTQKVFFLFLENMPKKKGNDTLKV